MKVSLDKFSQTLQRYVFEKVAPIMRNSADQFILGCSYGGIERKVKEYMPKLTLIGVTMDGEQIDLESLECVVKHGFEATKDKKATFPLPTYKYILDMVMGFAPREEDLEPITFSVSDWDDFKRMF